MEQTLLVHEEAIEVNGRNCQISLYHRGNAKYFAITRFSIHDAFICDGFSAEDVLVKQRKIMPLALSCRLSLRKETMSHA